jgi:2-desacetyl-2-hydroxyethyl bacteriochlorophyllide A dehydrogenase
VFTAPRCVEIHSQALPEPAAGQARVRSLCSAISSGTESLIYTGQFPPELTTDDTIAALSGRLEYPLRYGYSVSGQVEAVGPGVDPQWLGRRVFGFNPHESDFVAPLEDLQPIPDDLSPEEAVFLPNMETAVNLVMDGCPLIGERVLVLGQGIVGLLTAALLSRFPLEALITLDRYPLRRKASIRHGAHACFDPQDVTLDELDRRLPGGADLCFELSGAPAALDLAIRLTGFDGRIVVGSWYGQKRAPIDLGGRFHRSRIRLISSQVSTLAPALSGRWDKQRRFAVAWEMLRQIRPASLITHRFPLESAAQAYRLLDEHPEQAIQVLLTYP